MTYKPPLVLAALLLAAHDAVAGDVGYRFDHRWDRRH